MFPVFQSWKHLIWQEGFIANKNIDFLDKTVEIWKTVRDSK